MEKGKISFENESESFIENIEKSVNEKLDVQYQRKHCNWFAKDNSFAELFREQRIRKEITFREIAAAIGLSIGYLNDIEKKRRNPPDAQTVKKIEEILEITDGRLSKAALEEYSRTARGAMELRIKELEDAIKTVLRYISSHQVYDKDARGILERALNNHE